MMNVFSAKKVIGHLHNFVGGSDGSGAGGLCQFESSIDDNGRCKESPFELQELTVDFICLFDDILDVIVKLLQFACRGITVSADAREVTQFRLIHGAG